MKRTIVIIGMLLLVGACAPKKSEKALEAMGFTNINASGWAPLSCGEGDSFRTKFTATNHQGMRVSGVVCCGILKSCTVRL